MAIKAKSTIIILVCLLIMVNIGKIPSMNELPKKNTEMTHVETLRGEHLDLVVSEKLEKNVGITYNEENSEYLNDKDQQHEYGDLQPSLKILNGPYTPSPPFDIDNDSAFGTSGYNFPGAGTPGNPYRIEGYNITSLGVNLIDIQGTSVYFTISNNWFNGIDQNSYGIYTRTVSNGNITGNFVNNTDYGIFVHQSNDFNLTNNIVNNSHGGIGIYGSDFNVIKNNTVKNNNYGFYLAFAENNTVSDNIVIKNNNIGIYLGDSSSKHNIIVNNTIEDNNGDGIRLSHGAKYNIVRNNNISGSNTGIYLRGPTFGLSSHIGTIFNNISHNRIFNNNQYGIRLELNTTFNNTIYDNTITNSGYGLYFSSLPTNNTVSYNIISDNSNYGTRLDSTSGFNIIKWNRFINNYVGGTQASSDNSTNIFTHNYWDDWTTPDSDLNGFVDNPYVLDGSTGLLDSYPRTHPYLFRDPIYIDENTDFPVEGFSGKGTQEDPYVLEGYFIINSSEILIHIQDTTAHFKIQNCLLRGITGNHDGILLSNVMNGSIEANIISSSNLGINLISSGSNMIFSNDISNSTWHGISIDSSSNTNNLSANTIHHNKIGIDLVSSYYNTLVANTVYNNTWEGIKLEQTSDNNTIQFNTIYNNTNDGILVISSNNTVISSNVIHHNNRRGILIQFSKNITIDANNISNSGNEGVKLDTCNHSIIQHNIINNSVHHGIEFWLSVNNTVFDNEVFYNSWNGILLANSPNNTLEENLLYNNSQSGINLYTWGPISDTISSSDNIIVNNMIFNSTVDGIYLDSISNFNTIIDNLVTYNDEGIFLHNCSKNIVANNTVQENEKNGILLMNDAHDNIVSNNTIKGHGYRGIRCEYTENNTITKNTVFDNNEDGIWLFNSINNTLTRNDLFGNNWNGILLEYSNSNTIFDNFVYNNSDNGVALVEASNKNTIDNNTIHNNDDHGIMIDVNDNTITNNTVHDNKVDGIICLNNENNTISKNKLRNNNYFGLVFWNSSSNTIEANELINDGMYWGARTPLVQKSVVNNLVNGRPLIFWENIHGAIVPLGAGQVILVNCTEVSITGQDFTASSSGIMLVFCSKVTIIENTFDDTYRGIEFAYSNDSLIENNTIANIILIGIQLVRSHNNELKNNSISGGENGIVLRGASDNNISYNLIFGHDLYGLTLIDTSDGVKSSGNTLHFNDFADNNIGGTQASDDGSTNVFSYNYWNDWTSPDNNNDGFVDVPYAIDGAANNADQFPRTSAIHELSNPVVVYPNGGETLSGAVMIQWTAATDSWGHSVSYSLYYSANAGSTWIKIASGLITTTSYPWDTTTMADSINVILIRVNATCTEGLIKIDDSDSTFSIQNPITTTTTTTTLPTSTTTTTTTPPATTTTTILMTTTTTTTTTLVTLTISAGSAPGWLFTVLLLMTMTVIISFRRRSKIKL